MKCQRARPSNRGHSAIGFGTQRARVIFFKALLLMVIGDVPQKHDHVPSSFK